MSADAVETAAETVAKDAAEVVDAVDPAAGAEVNAGAKVVGGFLDVIRKLIDKVPWFSEQDHRDAHSAVDDVQKAIHEVLPEDVAAPPAPGPAPEPQAPPTPPTPAEQAAAAVAAEQTGGQSTATAASAQSADHVPDPTTAPPAAEGSTGAPAGESAPATGSGSTSSPSEVLTASTDTVAPDAVPPEVTAWLADHPDVALVARPTPTSDSGAPAAG